MPFTLAPRILPEYFLDACWPYPAAYNTVPPGAAVTANAIGRFAGQNISTFSAPSGAGTPGMGRYREQVGAAFVIGSRNIANGIHFAPQLTVAGLTTSQFYRPSEMFRVCRVQCHMAMTAPMGTDGGIAFCMASDNGAVATYPTGGGNGWGFGVQGDGAGGLNWFSKQVVALTFNEQVPLGALLPAPVTEIMCYDFEIIEANAAIGLAVASLRLFINGVLVISRSWAPGTVLPTYDGAGGNIANSMVFGVCVNVAGSMFIGPTRFLAGRYTIENNELLNALNGSI